MVYFSLKLLLKLALRIFFRRYQVAGRDKLTDTTAPLIVVGNHPNTFMDALIVATLMPQRVAFVGNGSIFNKYTRPILRYFNVIPVYRKKDMPNADTPLSQSELNKFTFSRCYNYLAQKGTISLFPEGTSEIERRLRDIKTGTARIALGAEYEHDFKLGIKILPIGLNYSDPTHFRSEVFINVGDPIYLTDFTKKYNPESFEAVEELTEEIGKQLASLTIVTEDDEEDGLVRNIEILFKNQLFKELSLPDNNKNIEFRLVKQIINAIRYFEKNQPQLYKKIYITTNNYLENLQKLGITDQVLSRSQREGIWWPFIENMIVLILCFPLFLYGFINNYIPYKLPAPIARWISTDISYRGPMLMSVGIFTFTFFHIMSIWLVQHIFGQTTLTVLYAISLPLSGYFALWYWQKVEQFAHIWQTQHIIHRKQSLINALLEERKALFDMLERAKNEYLKQI